MKNTPQTITTVDEKEGGGLSIAGGTYRILISGKQTGGSFAVIDMLIPPGGGPNPHAHAHMQESYYVLEGEVVFKTEKGNYIAKKGSFLNIPLGDSFIVLKTRPLRLYTYYVQLFRQVWKSFSYK
jgi:quercetin dioxygenase-like cupin family protein